MNSRKAEQTTIEDRIETKKPRFKIEKLEERIAPGGVKHPGGHGGGVGQGGGCGNPRHCFGGR